MAQCRSPHDPQDAAVLRRKSRALLGAIVVTLVAFVLQLVGAWYTGSLALLGDTAHLFADLFSLFISWLAVILAARPATKLRSFGLFRLEVLAAFVNGLLLAATALFLAWESVERLVRGAGHIDAIPLLLVATAGLLLNLLSAWVLSRAMVEHSHGHGHGHSHDHSHGHTDEHEHECGHEGHAHAHASKAAASEAHKPDDRNLRAAFLHVLSDALSSVAVMVGAALAYFLDWHWVDPVLALVLAALIARWSVRLIKDSAHVLLESAPQHLDVEAVSASLRQADGRVRSVNDLHIWEITSRMYSATAEVEVEVDTWPEADALREALHGALRKHGIAHVVLALRPFKRG